MANKEAKAQKKENQAQRVERYLAGGLELFKALLSNPVTTGLVGYGSATLMQHLARRSDGSPALAPAVPAALKAISVAYPVARAMGGGGGGGILGDIGRTGLIGTIYGVVYNTTFENWKPPPPRPGTPQSSIGIAANAPEGLTDAQLREGLWLYHKGS